MDVSYFYRGLEIPSGIVWIVESDWELVVVEWNMRFGELKNFGILELRSCGVMELRGCGIVELSN